MTHLLMATRIQSELEAEPVLVRKQDGNLELILDDGSVLLLDWAELCEAVEEREAA